MGSTLSTTFGYGFVLTEEEVAHLAEVDEDEEGTWDQIENAIGSLHGLEVAAGYFYDYWEEDGTFAVIVKRTSFTMYGAGASVLPEPAAPMTTPEEWVELGVASERLGRKPGRYSNIVVVSYG